MSRGEWTEKMCRACLSTDGRYSQLISLYSGGCAVYEVPKKMMNVGSISVREGDGLPGTICQKCVFLIKVTDCFKRQIKMADKELRRICVSSTKTAANSSDSEIEDLAYDPEYISDKVKIEVEKAFRRKHRMLRDREFEEMSKILHNLDKKQFFPSLFVKQEIIEHDNFMQKTDSVENVDTSDNKLYQFPEKTIIESETPVNGVKEETTVCTATEDSAEDLSRNNLNAGQFPATENPETPATENSADFYDNEAIKPAQPETYQSLNGVNTDPNIIVISDTSDGEASKCAEKAATAMPLTSLSSRRGDSFRRNGVLSSFLRGEKPISRDVFGRKLIEAKTTCKAIQAVKARKAQAKKVPRTYFLCTSCNIQLQSVAAVLLHHNEVHSPSKNSLQCRMCEKTFATKLQLLAHFDRHSETHLFRCSYCPNEFVLKDNLTRHMLSHTRSRNKRARISTENSTEGGKPETPANVDEDSGKENGLTINSQLSAIIRA